MLALILSTFDFSTGYKRPGTGAPAPPLPMAAAAAIKPPETKTVAVPTLTLKSSTTQNPLSAPRASAVLTTESGEEVPRLRLGVAQADDFASQRVLMQVSKEAAALPLGWLEGALLSLILLFGWICYLASLPTLVFQSLYVTLFTSERETEAAIGMLCAWHFSSLV